MTYSPVFADTAAALEAMSPKPVDLFSIFGFPISNSMIAEAIAVIVVVTVIQIAMRKPQLVPSGLQNFVEWLVELIANFVENLAGHKTMRLGFWYFGGLLVFVLFENILALMPGFGTIGYGHGTNIWNFVVTKPFLRGANANVNVTAAYSAIFFVMFFYWIYRGEGFGGSFYHVFGSKVKFSNIFANWAFILIFFVVGWIDVFSILIIRPIAFTFRLFGNIYGGEYLLDSMYKLAPNFAFIILVPFYFYELLVAFVQAFVIFALTAAFTGMITNTGHPEAEEAKH
jgi:F-type H+-transporting ATPase subunit a